MNDTVQRIAPALLLLLCCGAAAQPPAPPTQTQTGVSLSDAWFAKTAGVPLAGFFTVTNTGDQPLLMTGWQSPDCRRVRFADASKEQMLDSMTVPAHDKMVFARGGYHLVCEGPAAGMDAMRSIPVTIRFHGGRSLSVPFEIRTVDRPGAARPVG